EQRDILPAKLGLQGIEVVEGNARNAGQVRPEAVGERGLAADGERSEGEPVESVLDADDPLALRSGAAELQRSLDRLRAAVREQHFPDRRGGAAHKFLGEQR